MVLRTCLLLCGLLGNVIPHGYLFVPLQRSSMWRGGFNVPANYDDNGLRCGGPQVQFKRNNGRCGICGDPFHATIKDNEAGGKYATGTISKTYQEGDWMAVEVKITSNHKGYFEFRLCPHNDIHTPATQACLDRHLLQVEYNGLVSTKYELGPGRGIFKMNVRLPPGVTCSQCVFQWKYRTGNSWGCDVNSACGIGKGPQEHFINCADIAITRNGQPQTHAPTLVPTPRPIQVPNTAATQQPLTPAPATAAPATAAPATAAPATAAPATAAPTTAAPATAVPATAVPATAAPATAAPATAAPATAAPATAAPTTAAPATAAPTTAAPATAAPATAAPTTTAPATAAPATAAPATAAPATAAPTTAAPATAAPATAAPATAAPATATAAPATAAPATAAPATAAPAPATAAPTMCNCGTSAPSNINYDSCRAVGVWADFPGMTKWCRTMCSRGKCPPSLCHCGTSTPSSISYDRCRATGAWKGQRAMTRWCRTNCAHAPSFCPKSHCDCS
ncbi:uncharacterized protein [Haliotis asinina]|uniref:uncharacterized protein n=1 Tax=Haliotis asinina TaxID=109174 RepID=UPI003531E4C9